MRWVEREKKRREGGGGYRRCVGQSCTGVAVAHEFRGPEEGDVCMASREQPGEGHAADLLLCEDDARPRRGFGDSCSLDRILWVFVDHLSLKQIWDTIFCRCVGALTGHAALALKSNQCLKLSALYHRPVSPVYRPCPLLPPPRMYMSRNKTLISWSFQESAV